MRFSEEQIKDIIALKESLIGQIDRHRKAVDMLERNITILDVVLKESSFTRASDMDPAAVAAGGAGADVPAPSSSSSSTSPSPPPPQSSPPTTQPPPTTSSSSSPPPIPIKKGGSDTVIANAYVTAESISIVLSDEISVTADTPPFKSFFMDRIIGEMRKKDSAEARQGTIPEESIIECTVTNRDGTADIGQITIRNYRLRERTKDLLSTAGWSLSRMLEKVGK